MPREVRADPFVFRPAVDYVIAPADRFPQHIAEPALVRVHQLRRGKAARVSSRRVLLETGHRLRLEPSPEEQHAQ